MKIRENLVLRRIGSEYVIIVPGHESVDLTEVFTLNETSAWIWEQLKNKEFTSETVVELMLQHYDVDQDRAMKDVQAFLDILIEGKLITQD